MQFRVFFKVKVQNQDICLGCLKFLIFFGGEQKMLGLSLTYAEKIRVPPPGVLPFAHRIIHNP